MTGPNIAAEPYLCMVFFWRTIELRIFPMQKLRLSRTFPGVSDNRTPSVRSQMCMFRFLKYFYITLPYYLCKIIHILLFIKTNIWLQHNPAYSGRHLDTNEILVVRRRIIRKSDVGEVLFCYGFFNSFFGLFSWKSRYNKHFLCFYNQ